MSVLCLSAAICAIGAGQTLQLNRRPLAKNILFYVLSVCPSSTTHATHLPLRGERERERESACALVPAADSSARSAQLFSLCVFFRDAVVEGWEASVL